MNEVSRRKFVGGALAIAAATPVLEGQEQTNVPRSPDHHLPNERQPGPNNVQLERQNPDSVWAPETDNGTMKPFKYSFNLSHKELDTGGWTRQVTVRDLPVSTHMAGVEMALTEGGMRELHWHVSAEWSYMISG